MMMALMSSCNKLEVESVQGTEAVYISAAMSSVDIQTKAPYLLTLPTYDDPLNVDIWASTTSGEYEASDLDGSGEDGAVAMHTTATFQSGENQLLKDIIYSEKNQGVYFVGFHPNGWNGTHVTEENVGDVYNATVQFNGREDVMFAPQTMGKYGSGTNPHLLFHHLLTYVTIEIKVDVDTSAEEEDQVTEEESIRNAWGNLTELKITSSNRVSVGLYNGLYSTDQQGESVYDFDAGVAFQNDGGDGKLSFHYKDTDAPISISNGYEMTRTAEEVAYVMCSPVFATEANHEEYSIYLSTANRDVVVLPLDLRTTDGSPFIGSTRGKHFKVVLNFKRGDNITISTGVTDWTTGGTATGNIGESNIVNNSGNES